MAVYKVIQDIEAEDKLLGWMTLKQFIFFCITLFSIYLCVMSVLKHFPFALIILVPIVVIAGTLSAPLSKVQPTEIWLAARVRFFIKPRKRIWDQTGIEELVTITVPKTEHLSLTKGFSDGEVQSRLQALASTLDSRGWAVRNSGYAPTPAFAGVPRQGYGGNQNPVLASRDRLVTTYAQPVQPTARYDLPPKEDILDARANPVAQRFEEQIRMAAERAYQQAIENMKAANFPATPASKANTPATPVTPSIQTPAPTPPPARSSRSGPVQQSDGPAAPRIRRAAPASSEDSNLLKDQKDLLKKSSSTAKLKSLDISNANQKPENTSTMTPAPSPAILELAKNDEYSVATLAHEAKRNDEVIIKLH